MGCNIEKNNYQLVIDRGKNCFKDKEIEELGLSLRTLVVLKRSNIRTLNELRHISQDDLQNIIKDFRSSDVEELNSILQEYGIRDTHITIRLIMESKTIEYNFFENNIDKISSTILELVYKEYEFTQRYVIDWFAPGLAYWLMMKGYIYADMVYRDADVLINGHI